MNSPENKKFRRLKIACQELTHFNEAPHLATDATFSAQLTTNQHLGVHF
jgi:hypothetical protein